MATEVFEWLVANGYAQSVEPGVGASSPPPPPRCAAPPLTLVASSEHGGGELRDSRLLRCDTPPPAVMASDGHGGGGTLRDPLRELFERLVADGLVHLASPACGSPFRFSTINVGLFRASYLLNLNAQNSEATLLITRKDTSEAFYPQGQSVFHQHRPRIQELDVDGKDFNAQEEAECDLSDAPAPFTTKPKLFAQPSMLLSDIGLKSRKAHVCTTTELNSAIRDFDHATNDQLIRSCTSAHQFCLITDFMLGLHHQHDIGPLKPESDQSVENYVRNLTEAKNIGKKCDKQTSEDIAPEPDSAPPEPDSAPNSDTESGGNFQEERLMEKFNKMLVDCVFFALPHFDIFSKISSF